MRIAIAGASGFVGQRLARELSDAGHQVLALGRDESTLPKGALIQPVKVDVGVAEQLAGALAGCDLAFYLVHSMAGARFVERDLELARGFAAAVHEAGVQRVVYLGALGRGDLSPHLASRQEVGDALRSLGADVVELRAAVILGAGSISFEMLRHLVERLPAMVCPRWVRTKLTPIGIGDMLRYLHGSLTVEPGIYEIGVADATSYREMMAIYATARGLRPRLIVDVPLLTLRLSSHWVDLIAPVERSVSHSLIESLAIEVIAHDHSRTEQAFGFVPMTIHAAMRDALDDQARIVSRDLLDLEPGTRDGLHIVRVAHALPAADAPAARADLAAVGGDLRWYGIMWAWWLRLLLGRLLREPAQLVRPERLEPGAKVDWWIAERTDPGALVLRAQRWHTGDAWLGYRVDEADHIDQVAVFRPRGIPGLLYWRALAVIHRFVFRAMVRHRAHRAHVAARLRRSK